VERLARFWLERALSMKGLDREFREAVRLFVRSPAFVAAVVLPMALALGANTALFTVIRGVLLRPLPYAEPERLVRIYRTSARNTLGGPLSALNFAEDLTPAASVKARAAWDTGSASLAGEGAPEHIRLGAGTASLLPVLGLHTATGRWFSPDEEQQGQHRRVVLSHALWLRRFGGDPAALGKTLQLEGEPYVVVGVLPPGIELPELCDAWVPLSFEPMQLQPGARNWHYLKVVARLAPSATLESARRELAETGRRTIADHPEAYASFNFVFSPVSMHEDVVRSVRPTLVLLFGAVALVLLIACFNVGNLMLARSTARQRELAIRSALGAGRSALVRKLLVESLVLAVTAGLVGLVLSSVTTSALLSLAPDALPRAQTIRPDLSVLAFSLGISIASGVLFGLVPALSASDLDLEGTLRGSGSMRPHARKLRRLLVMADVGLALVLLCAASLLLRSFVATLGVDPGFRADGVLTLQAVVPTPSGTPPDRAEASYRGYVDRALVALRAVPGAQAVGGISMLPLSGDRTDRLLTVEGERDDPAGERRSEEFRAVTPGSFETLRIPLLQGRHIEEADRAGAPPVVVINESFARKYFPRGDALGRRISLVSPPTAWATVVGVAGDVREFGLDQPVVPVMYYPADQQPAGGLTYVVRSNAPFAEASRRAATALQGVDANVPIFALRPYESLLSASVAERRFSLVLVATFAFLALVLAAVGLYGVVAYSVRQRTKEIGVRMAIGADPARIARLVASESVRMVGFGLALGLLGALATARLLAGFLYGVQPADPLAILAAAVVLALAAVLATLLPVRRATRVDPVIALAAE
jgi:putative ABC transport system permease protein